MSSYTNRPDRARYFERKAAKTCVRDGCKEPQQEHTVLCVGHDLTNCHGLIRALVRRGARRPRRLRPRVFVSLRGERMGLKEAAATVGVNYSTIRARMHRGMTPQQAIDMGRRDGC